MSKIFCWICPQTGQCSSSPKCSFTPPKHIPPKMDNTPQNTKIEFSPSIFFGKAEKIDSACFSSMTIGCTLIVLIHSSLPGPILLSSFSYPSFPLPSSPPPFTTGAVCSPFCLLPYFAACRRLTSIEEGVARVKRPHLIRPRGFCAHSAPSFLRRIPNRCTYCSGP